MERIKKFIENGDLKRLKFVCQTGGNNAKVKWVVEGYESMVFASIMFNRLPLTGKGIIHVFDLETEKWLGSIKKDENDIPRRYKADEDLTFADMYITVG